jgi:hypothetical protein
LQKEGVQTWHGHLAREKRTISREMPQGITGKMPVPRYFASASSAGGSPVFLILQNAGRRDTPVPLRSSHDAFECLKVLLPPRHKDTKEGFFFVSWRLCGKGTFYRSVPCEIDVDAPPPFEPFSHPKVSSGIY